MEGGRRFNDRTAEVIDQVCQKNQIYRLAQRILASYYGWVWTALNWKWHPGTATPLGPLSPQCPAQRRRPPQPLRRDS